MVYCLLKLLVPSLFFFHFSEPPRIVAPPSPAIISLENTRQVQFNCTAVGDPAPEITWRHNGAEATSSLMYHVNQFAPMPDPQGRGHIRTGTLSIFPLNEMDTGWVECVVGVVASEATTGGEELPQDVAGTRLSVLGEGSFDNLGHAVITE